MRFKMMVAAVVMLGLTACTDSAGAYDALQKAGYTEIVTGGYDAFACGEDDTFSTSFQAKGPTGINVTGTVCSGMFKGKTIRID